MAIPQSFIQELLARVDVVEVVGRHVQLKKAGANYSGLCPFHGEKTPSFTVSPSKQFFHCFGCGKNGNAIGFLMEHAGMGFIDAVKDLSQQVGLQVPDDDLSPQDKARAAERREKEATLTDVLEKAGADWRRCLKDAPRAIEYLKGRGLSGEVARRFGLGYAPEGWRHLASVFPRYDDPLLAESGLVIHAQEDGEEEKRYDRFRDRVMFPIRNVKGECIGFGGRVLGDGTPKYLNSPETPVFSKGRELYGLFEARAALRDAGYVLVTEGYMDVVALAQLGFPNAVATLGTACTTEHVHKLFRFTDAVVFSFDGDGAGRRAARKALDGALPYATDTRSVKFLFLPAEHDPDSFIREHGKDAFARCVGDAVPLSRFLVDSAREGCDLSTVEGRAKLASQARPLWAPLPDGAMKRQLLGELAELVQLPTRELTEVWALADSKSHPPAPPVDRYQNQSEEPSNGADYPPKNFSKPFRKDRPAPRQGFGPTGVRGRTAPPRREDRALQLLFTEPGAWDALSNAEHALLCGLPAPHGPLFAWLDSQHQEHGPQPWPALRGALPGHPDEDWALRLVAQTPEQIQNDADELRSVLRELTIEGMESELRRLATLAPSDPGAYERYRALDAEYRAVRAGSAAR